MPLLLVLWTASLGVANYLGLLIVLPICLVSWYSKCRIAFPIALFAALVSVGTSQEISFFTPGAMVALDLTVQALSFITIAAIVSWFSAEYERVRFAARRDYVTGIVNRQAFELKAEEMMRAAQAKGCPMLLVYLDLAGFKSVNDRYGHAAGDEVLKRFAVEGRAALRRKDCFGRMGGVEFALLINHAFHG